MEIAPIPGIRVMPVTRQRSADPELTALFEIEAPARATDDTYTASGRPAAGAEEDDEDEDGQEEEQSIAPEEFLATKNSSASRSRESTISQISFFA